MNEWILDLVDDLSTGKPLKPTGTMARTLRIGMQEMVDYAELKAIPVYGDPPRYEAELGQWLREAYDRFKHKGGGYTADDICYLRFLQAATLRLIEYRAEKRKHLRQFGAKRK
jgi:hypothetical protein